jgi:two-component system, cell cycle response regulator
LMPVRGNHFALVRDRGVLVRVDGDARGALASVPRQGLVIGRSSRAELSIRDESISRLHARIGFAYGAFVIEDLGSRNGTFVAGRPVSSCALQDGDLVQIGPHATFRFCLMDTAQESAIRQLYDSSVLDALTGAFNRRHFDQRLLSELAFARRHGTDVCLALFDIDHFKQINDQHGHSAGDSVLGWIAGVFREQVRAEDLVARYGGEEFVVLLRDSTLEGVHIVAERIRRRVEAEPLELPGGVRLTVTLSAGCSNLKAIEPHGGRGLLDLADHRLYLAKRLGRNRVVASD